MEKGLKEAERKISDDKVIYITKECLSVNGKNYLWSRYHVEMVSSHVIFRNSSGEIMLKFHKYGLSRHAFPPWSNKEVLFEELIQEK